MFGRNRTANDGLTPYCHICKLEYEKAQRGTPQGKRKRKQEWVRQKYGIGAKQFDALMRVKKCEICGYAFTKSRRRCIDHDHMTTKIRGIICGHCNSALGFVEDSPAVLRRAADYLEKHAEKVLLYPTKCFIPPEFDTELAVRENR